MRAVRLSICANRFFRGLLAGNAAQPGVPTERFTHKIVGFLKDSWRCAGGGETPRRSAPLLASFTTHTLHLALQHLLLCQMHLARVVSSAYALPVHVRRQR